MSGITYGRQPGRKLLLDYPTATTSEGQVNPPAHVNRHLADGPDVLPTQGETPLVPGTGGGTKGSGSQPTDYGELIVAAGDAEVPDPVAARSCATDIAGACCL
jgi:hypothetical protein